MILQNKKRIYYKTWVNLWLIKRKEYIKLSTYASYNNMIRNHLIPYLGDYYLDNLNNSIIQKFILEEAYIGKIDNSGGLSDKSIKIIITILKSSLRQAMDENLIEYFNLNFNYPRIYKRKTIKILSKLDQEKLITYLMNNPNSKNIGILLSLFTGLRIGELCALKWCDINFQKNILTVSKTLQRIYYENKTKIIITEPKSKTANREIPINNEFATFLKKYKSDQNDYLLTCKNRHTEPRSYRKYFNNILRTCNIEQINFHTLRHTFATNCINIGTDYKTVSELLGHSSVNITLNLYVHPQIQQKKKCINTIYHEFLEKE